MILKGPVDIKTDPRLIVALDVDSYRHAVRLVKSLSPYVKVFKIGSILFTICGPKIINYIHKCGGKVFLDLKYHDIPNTVAMAAVEATKLGVYILNVHALAGKAAMEATVKAVEEEAHKRNIFKPIVIAVTVLTSLHDGDLAEVGIQGNVQDLVLKLAGLAKSSRMDGVVASPHELPMLKKQFGENFVVVTPGIRPEWDQNKGDQKRVMTPREAVTAGADFIVIGRPIIAAKKPVKAVQKILEEIR